MTLELETAVALAFFGHLDSALVPDLAKRWCGSGVRSGWLERLAAGGVEIGGEEEALHRAWSELGNLSLGGDHVRPALAFVCERWLSGNCDQSEVLRLCLDISRVLEAHGGCEGELLEPFQYLLHDHRLLSRGWVGMDAQDFERRLRREARLLVEGDPDEPMILLRPAATDQEVADQFAGVELPAVRVLQLPRADADTLARFGPSPAVYDLVLDDPQFGDWSSVTAWPELRRLLIRGGRRTRDLSSFVACPSLVELSVSDWPDLESTAGVERCRNLGALTVSGPKLRALDGVESLPLEAVFACLCPALDDVTALVAIPTLRVVSLFETPLPWSQVERLREALPEAWLGFTPSESRAGIGAGLRGRWEPGAARPHPVD